MPEANKNIGSPRGLVRRQLDLFRQGWYLFLRDYQYRYKLTFLGYSWAIVRPLASAAPFIFIGHQFKFTSELPIPYSLYCLCGVLFWNVFWDAVSTPMTFMRTARHALASLPISPVAPLVAASCAAIINFVVTSCLILAMALYLKVSFEPSSIFVLAWLPLLLLAGLGIGLPFGAISCVYQDVNHGSGFLSQVLMWCTPIFYQTPESGLIRLVNQFNPATYLVDTPRAFLFGLEFLPLEANVIATAVSLGIFILGFVFFFRRMRIALEYVV